MMGALPQTATTLPPIFGGLIPGLTAGSGDEGGFDQILAGQANVAVPTAKTGISFGGEMPATPAPAPSALATGLPSSPSDVPADPAVAIPASPVPVTGRPAPAISAKTGATTSTPATKAIDLPASTEAEAPAPAPAKPVAKTDIAASDDVAATAAWLFSLTGRVAAPAAATSANKSPVATADAEDDSSLPIADAASGKVEAVIAFAPAAPAKAIAEPQTKDAKGEVRAASNDGDAPALTATAPKAREVAQAIPGAAVAAAEPKTVKPAADPSMTVLFTPAAATASAVADVAKPAFVAERVLDMTSDDAWIDQLASDIAATKSATNDISFRLMPRHLGRLDVSMMAGDNGVSLKLDTQHEATAVIVTAAQVRLVDDLRQQGVRVADAQVTCTPGESGRHSQGQDRASAQSTAYLIETAPERANARDDDSAANRRGRGRFA